MKKLKNRVGSIYVLTCLITMEEYVGQARCWKARWKGHCYSTRTGSSLCIHKAMRKYGAENFAITIVRRCPVEDLDRWEEYYVDKFETFTNGYNMTPGGNGVHNSPAVARKIARKAKERGKDPAYRAMMSDSSVAMYASPEGADVRLRIAKTLTGRVLSKKECSNHSAGLHKRYARPEEHVKTIEAANAHYASPAGAITRRRQSEAAQRRIASGVYHTEASRKLLSDKAKAQHARQRAKGMVYSSHPVTAESRAAISNTLLRGYADHPERAEAIRERNIGTKRSPETRSVMRTSQQARRVREALTA